MYIYIYNDDLFIYAPTPLLWSPPAQTIHFPLPGILPRVVHGCEHEPGDTSGNGQGVGTELKGISPRQNDLDI